MKNWIVAVGILFSIQAHAQAPQLTGRSAIRAVMPVAVEVIEQMERDSGRRFHDGELPAVMNSPDFEHRLSERIKNDPAFAPCRVDQCLLA